AYREALECAPQRAGSRARLSLMLLAQHRGDEALAEATREGTEVFRHWALATVHSTLGQGTQSDGMLRTLIEKHGEEAACQIARVQGRGGEWGAGFEWLERAYELRAPGLADGKITPRFRPLHPDPRWSPFLTKMRLEG